MTIARLIAKLKAARAEWEAALTTAPRAHWCEPGAAGAWSVKDVIVQVVYREQWCADRLGEALRGEAYAPCAMDQLPDDERSQLIYRQHRHRPLADVLAEAHFSYRRLVRAVEAHSDTSLAQPRAFLGEPEPRPLWQGLLSEVGEAYGRHGARLRAWLATGS